MIGLREIWWKHGDLILAFIREMRTMKCPKCDRVSVDGGFCLEHLPVPEEWDPKLLVQLGPHLSSVLRGRPMPYLQCLCEEFECHGYGCWDRTYYCACYDDGKEGCGCPPHEKWSFQYHEQEGQGG